MIETGDKILKAQPVETKIWNKTFVSLFFANMVMGLGQQMSSSLVAKYADYLGASATVVGMITGMFAATALLFKVFSGPMIDTFNRKYVLMGAMMIMTVAFISYSLSTTTSMLMVSRLIQGSGQAFSATCCLALAADALPPDKYGIGIGYFSLASVICQSIGPSVALILVGWIGYRFTFLVGASIMCIAVIAASRIKLEFHRVKKFKISLSNIIAKEVFVPTVVMFFLNMGFTVINAFLIIYAGRKGVDTGIGLFFTVYAVTLLFSRPLVGRLTARLGLVRVAAPAILCTAAAFVIISCSNSLPSFLVAAFVSAFGFGACQPSIQSLSMKSVPKERRGAASSTNYIGNDLGNLTGPVIAGMIVERFGYEVMWRVMTVPLFVAIAIVVGYRKRIRSIEEAFAASYAVEEA